MLRVFRNGVSLLGFLEIHCPLSGFEESFDGLGFRFCFCTEPWKSRRESLFTAIILPSSPSAREQREADWA